MAQTSVKDDFDVARAGGIADGMPRVINSAVAKVEIPFGRAVTRDADGEVSLPVNAGEVADGVLQGVALTTHFTESLPQGGVTPASYKVGDMVNVGRKVRVWVEVEDTPTPGDAVFVRFQDGDLGVFRTDADGADAAEITAGAEWASVKDTVTGLAQLDLNLP